MADEHQLLRRFNAARTPEELADFFRGRTRDEELTLRLYLGDERFDEMRQLADDFRGARAARAARAAPMRNVVVLPGIMGSELTLFGGGETLLWLSLWQIYWHGLDRLRLDAEGRLSPDGNDIRATNVLNKYYGKLVLHLGRFCNVRSFWYDWRKDLRGGAQELATFVRAEFGEQPVSLVAHSMGGLVARTLLAQRRTADANAVPFERLIMLGTPNHGSFEVPQIFAGVQDTVSKLIRLTAGVSGVAGLARYRDSALKAISSFPGVYQMMPWPEALPNNPDLARLYDPATYAAFNGHVSAGHLQGARARHQERRDAIDPDRMLYVAGFDQPTVVGVKDYNRLTDLASYEVNYLGDGSVPHSLGFLRDVPRLFVRRPHVELPQCPEVLRNIEALLDGQIPPDEAILRQAAQPRGTPQRAEDEWRARRERELREFEELLHRVIPRAPRSTTGPPPTPPALQPDERALEELLVRDVLGKPVTAVISDTLGPPVAAAAVPRVRFHLVWADLAESPDRYRYPETQPRPSPVDAIAVGQYGRLAPQGGIRSLDESLTAAQGAANVGRGGLLAQYVERGLILGELGTPFLLPDPREPRRLIAVAGMGVPGRFGRSELTVLARELCWALDRLDRRHLALQLIGARRGGLPPEVVLAAFLDGLGQAVQAISPGRGQSLDEVTFVDIDPEQVWAMHHALRNLLRSGKTPLIVEYSGLAAGEEARLYRAARAARQAGFQADWDRTRSATSDPEFPPTTRVSVSLEGGQYSYGALTPEAALPQRSVDIDPNLVGDANDRLVAAASRPVQQRWGRVLGQLLVPGDLREQFRPGGPPLVLTVDATMARLHWELMVVGRQALVAEAEGPEIRDRDTTFLGLSVGLTRQLRTPFAPAPQPAPTARQVLRVLVVADPARDAPLEGAQTEGEEVAELFEAFNRHYQEPSRVEVVRLIGPAQAQRLEVLSLLLERPFDVLHYAGHCYFDTARPEASGWIFGAREVLSARELRRVDRVPRFVFANACESGVTPDRLKDVPRKQPEERTAALVPSFAEAFFAQGVANFICTGWPVDDAAARLFARTLYAALLGLVVEDRPTLRVRGVSAEGPVSLHEALVRARRATAERRSGLRTWGAYQHYGNPFHRFFDSSVINPRLNPIVERAGLATAPQPAPAAAQAPPPPPPTAGAFARVHAVLRMRSSELRNIPGVVDVRPGFRYKDGWTTGEPALVVVVENKLPEDQVRPEERLPRVVDGVPLDVTVATPAQLLRRFDAVRAAEVLPAEESLLTPGEQPVPVSAASRPERGLFPYLPPPGVALDEVHYEMTVLCHASPDEGFAVLSEFLGEVRSELTVGMYDFSAPHVRDRLLEVLEEGRTLEMVLDPGLSLTNGGDPETNPKANDVTEDRLRTELEALGERLRFAWAAVKRQGKTTAGIFPSAYHIKVAVRDGEAFWLSSGNWQSTNQPPPGKFPAPDDDPPDNLRTLLRTYNREWHVVVEHAGLAETFRQFLRWDREQAEPLQADGADRALPEQLPDLLIPVVEEPEAERGRPVHLFARKPFRFTARRKLRVRPLLTPDNYAKHVKPLIESAQRKLYFQNQYINLGKQQTPEFIGLWRALRDKVNDPNLDARIILRDIIGVRETLEALEGQGFDMRRVKVQKATHTKGIVVDGQVVLVGSHNWSSQGTTQNRDASLIFRDREIARYFEELFLHDWDGLARQRLTGEAAAPRLAVGGRTRTPAGFVRIPWTAYFED